MLAPALKRPLRGSRVSVERRIHGIVGPGNEIRGTSTVSTPPTINALPPGNIAAAWRSRCAVIGLISTNLPTAGS
jgi:hypothetical protein